MKYAIITAQGYTELHEDSGAVPPQGAITLTDAQYQALISGQSIIQNGVIVTNPNPPKLF